VIHTLE